MEVFIDTSNNKEVIVSVTINGKEDKVVEPLNTRKAQIVLPTLEQLLKKHKKSLQDITAIKVNPGPGSFTGLRVGVAIANTLGYLLQIPVNNNKVGEFVDPIYS